MWWKRFVKRHSLRRRKPFIYLPLMIILLCISIGYAYLNTSLYINGTSMLASARWDVHFDNVQVKIGSVTPTIEPTITDDTTVSFSVTLENPGDYYEFFVDVVNAGTLDAMIDTFSIQPVLTEDQQKYLEYSVTYEDGTALEEKQRLDAGTVETLKIAFKYKTLDNIDDYPDEDENIPIGVSIDYVQATGSEIDVPHKDAQFLTGPEVNVKMKQLAGDDTTTDNYNTYDTNILAIKESPNEPETSNKESKNIVSTNESKYPIYMWYENGTIYWWSEDNSPSLNSNASFMFTRLSNLTDIEGLYYFDASHATTFASIFARDISMIDYDYLVRWKTSNVTNMRAAFGACSSLKNISGLEYWDVSNVTDISLLFTQCISLESLVPLRNWNVSNVTNMKELFYCLVSLNSLDGLENWNVSKVTNMHLLFAGNSSIGDMLIEDLSPIANWNVSKVEDMSYMFQRITKIKNVNALANWKPVSAINFHGLFYYCSDLANIDGLVRWNTPNVTNFASIFYSCTSLTNLDSLSSWDVTNVTDMSYMCENCTSLTDASGINNWNISSSADFSYMFYNAGGIHPDFTRVAGTWDSNGTFTPN